MLIEPPTFKEQGDGELETQGRNEPRTFPSSLLYCTCKTDCTCTRCCCLILIFLMSYTYACTCINYFISPIKGVVSDRSDREENDDDVCVHARAKIRMLSKEAGKQAEECATATRKGKEYTE